MAATPMAMPSADRPARSLRVRMPTLASRARIPRPQRAQVRRGAGLRSSACRPPWSLHGGSGRSLSETTSPSSISITRGMRAAIPMSWVMTTMVAPCVVQLGEQVQHRGAGRRVQVPGGLVGQHQGRAAHQGPGDGHPLALAARQLGRQRGQLVRQADSHRALGRRPAALGQRGAGVEQAVRHIVEDALVLGQEELLEDEADPRAPAAPTAPGRRAGPRRGP